MAQWLTVPEVAERYRVSKRTVYRWYKSGRLRPVKIGREWLLPETEGQSLTGRAASDACELPSGHVLALVAAADQAAALEARLLEIGKQSGARLCRGQWRQPAAEADVDLAAVLRHAGEQGVLQVWQHEVAAAAREGRRLQALADPPPSHFRPFERLLKIERATDLTSLGPGSIVCLYRADELTGTQLHQLLQAHSLVCLATDDGRIEFRQRSD